MTDHQTIPAYVIRNITGALPKVWMGEGDERQYVETQLPVVALCERGRDCDGYEFERLKYMQPELVQAEIDHAEEWADGPIGHYALSAESLREWHEAQEERRRGLRQGWDDERY